MNVTSLNNLKQTAQGLGGFITKNVVSAAILVISSLLAIFLSFNYASSHVHFWTTKTNTDIRNIIISGVQNMHQLTTATMDIKESIVLDENAQILGIRVGNTHLVYEGVGTVQAGINLDKLQVMEQETNQPGGDKVIQILLPAPAITAINLDVNRSSTLASYTDGLAAKQG